MSKALSAELMREPHDGYEARICSMCCQPIWIKPDADNRKFLLPSGEWVCTSRRRYYCTEVPS